MALTSCIGFSQLCWHNFRIIGTVFDSISIGNYASIIGSSLHVLEGMASYPIGPQHVEMPSCYRP